ncbi:MAG: ABC transporter ATP-binding protein [Actinomycetota bacterium]|nr:ABC transporter ATP-binding protein [Actinomycetota bacterium]
MSVLATTSLTKHYGDQVVVDDLNLSVDRGDLYGFLGPNGAGKSTTIRIALGLVFPTSGSVEVCDSPVFSRARSDGPLRLVGAVVEEPAFWDYLSGRRNLELFARAAGPPDDRAARLAQVDEALRIVALEHAGRKHVKAYSHGMRQRLGIARALLGAPELLVLDEPTNGLDPQGMREVRRLLRRLADDGVTVFVSSHLLSEVEAMCDKVGVLSSGRLVADGPPASLRKASGSVVYEVDDGDTALGVLRSLEGVVVEDGATADAPARIRVRLREEVTPARVNAALVGRGVQVGAVIPERERLEDVFLSLTEEEPDSHEWISHAG